MSTSLLGEWGLMDKVYSAITRLFRRPVSTENDIQVFLQDYLGVPFTVRHVKLSNPMNEMLLLYQGNKRCELIQLASQLTEDEILFIRGLNMEYYVMLYYDQRFTEASPCILLNGGRVMLLRCADFLQILRRAMGER